MELNVLLIIMKCLNKYFDIIYTSRLNYAVDTACNLNLLCSLNKLAFNQFMNFVVKS